MLSARFWIFIALILTSCAEHQPPVTGGTTARSAGEIRYVSSDLSNAFVFAEGSARAGSILGFSPGLWPPSPTREFQTDDRVQCLSMGTAHDSIEFAIKRPIREGDRYRCLRTSFRVTQCFWECRAAIVEIESPLGGGVQGTLTSYMYVDSCVGVLAFSQITNLAEGIPPRAPWLRGEVGILADPSYPECNLYP